VPLRHPVLLELACAAVLLSLGLNVWAWAVALRFPLHRRLAPPARPPPVTLLKPLQGADPSTPACLESWLTQDYAGPVQVLFAIGSADDPAGEVVRRLLAAHPDRDAELVVCPASRGANSKISKLIQLGPRRKHDLIVVSDADVRVPPDLLANVVVPLLDERVGLVTCLYRLANPTSVAMRWEAIGLHADFWTQVLQARSLGFRGFALGAVMATTAPHLEAAGGFAAVADHLADDYELGRRTARTGARVELSTVVVDCWEARRTWSQVWRHQTRWARTLRICQPGPYFLSVLNNVTLWAVIAGAVVAAGSPGAVVAGWVPVTCVVVRILTAWHNQIRLAGPAGFWRTAGWVPVKDLLQAAVWAAAFLGRSVWWRGERYRVGPDGTLTRTSKAGQAAADTA
jgi:ceramide glucosyltransferase